MLVVLLHAVHVINISYSTLGWMVSHIKDPDTQHYVASPVWIMQYCQGCYNCLRITCSDNFLEPEIKANSIHMHLLLIVWEIMCLLSIS